VQLTKLPTLQFNLLNVLLNALDVLDPTRRE
jgi:hypothetical protein